MSILTSRPDFSSRICFTCEGVDVRPPESIFDANIGVRGHFARGRFGSERVIVNAGELGIFAFQLAAVFKQQRLSIGHDAAAAIKTTSGTICQNARLRRDSTNKSRSQDVLNWAARRRLFPLSCGGPKRSIESAGPQAAIAADNTDYSDVPPVRLPRIDTTGLLGENGGGMLTPSPFGRGFLSQ